MKNELISKFILELNMSLSNSSGVEQVFNGEIAKRWDEKAKYVTYYGIKNPIKSEIMSSIHDGISVADIGCGAGKIIQGIDKNVSGCKLTGLDISHDMISVAEQKQFTGDNRVSFINNDFMKYQFNALPVVDLYNHLKGIVTWDDVQDIVEEETTDEIFTSSGIVTDLGDDDDELLTGSLGHSIKARLPWLFITLIGEFFAVTITSKYARTFNALPIAAAFMPLLAGLGGNIGTQSITLMVRGLSTGQVTLSTGWNHLLREAVTGLSIGAIFGFLVMCVTFGWQHSIGLGIIVGIAMSLNMTIATVIGTCTPLILKRLHIDPAVASGPVIATAIDVIGLAIYLTLVTWYFISI